MQIYLRFFAVLGKKRRMKEKRRLFGDRSKAVSWYMHEKATPFFERFWNENVPKVNFAQIKMIAERRSQNV